MPGGAAGAGRIDTYGICKAFRRHMAQDVDTGRAVTCPLGPSNVTPLAVVQRVVEIVDGGLDRVLPLATHTRLLPSGSEIRTREINEWLLNEVLEELLTDAKRWIGK